MCSQRPLEQKQQHSLKSSADRGKLHPRAEQNKRNAWVSFLVEGLQLCSSTTDLCRSTAVDFNVFQTQGLLDRGSLSFGARLVG